MINDTFLLPKGAVRIWELDVPIVEDKDKEILYVYLTDEISVPFNYSELCHRISQLPSSYTVILYLNTPGGIISSGLMIVDAINETKAWVVGKLVGDVMSIGTVIAMACDELQISPDLTFMIHNYSGGMSGKGNEMKARQNFVDEHLSNTFSKYYTGFLTEEELLKVIEGTDLWFNAEEVTSRWANKAAGVSTKNA